MSQSNLKEVFGGVSTEDLTKVMEVVSHLNYQGSVLGFEDCQHLHGIRLMVYNELNRRARDDAH